MGKKGKKKDGGGGGGDSGGNKGGQPSSSGGQQKPPKQAEPPPPAPTASQPIASVQPAGEPGQGRGGGGRGGQGGGRGGQGGGPQPGGGQGGGPQPGGGRGGQGGGRGGQGGGPQPGGGRGGQGGGPHQGGGRGGQGGGRGDGRGGGRGGQQEGRGRGVPPHGGGGGPPHGGGGGPPHGGGGGPPQGFAQGAPPPGGAPPAWNRPQTQPAPAQPSPLQPPPSSDRPQQTRPSPPQQTPPGVSPSSSSSSISSSSTQVTKKMSDMSLSSLPIPKRDKPATHGYPFTVETNHLALSFKDNNMKIYHYDVDVKPEKPFRMYRQVVEEFRRKNYPNNNFGFDGRKNIFTNIMMDEERTDTFRVFDEEKSPDHPGIEYTVTVKYANEFRFNKLLEYMKNGSSLQPPQIVIQALDVVLRHPANANRNFVSVGRSYFSAPKGQIIQLGGGLNLWYGFYQSAILGWKPFLNVDVAHKGFPEAVNCVEALKNITNCDINRPLERREYENFRQYMKGLKVVYQIPNQPNSKRTYKISDLAETPNKKMFKDDKDGNKEISVAEYFARKKNFRLKYGHLPSLQAGVKSANRDCCLPMELCTIVEGQVLNKKLDENQTSNMVRNAARPTYERKQRIMDSIKLVNHNSDPCVNQFGITVNSQFERIPARVLPPPDIMYSGQIIKVRDGVWNPGKFNQSCSLERWAIINLDERTYDNTIQGLATEFSKTGNSLGFKISPPQMCSIKIRRNEDIRNPLKAKFEELQKQFGNNKIQLFVVIISPFGEMYGKVKQVAELYSGVLTQCLKSRTVSRLNRSTVQNILLKVNAKLDGTNHNLNLTAEPRFNFLAKPIIIMGADVTHPSPDQTDIPSVAAVTASFDVCAFRYACEWRLQPARLEIIEDLAAIVKTHLMTFYRKNKAKPEKIVFYRDGVSEGQFKQVLEEEVQAIRKACKSLQNDYEPQVTFLVVQKRHHTRLFPSDKDAVGKNKNVPAGTVVDTQITHPTEKDFYLNSHASIQGTSRPTKYHVVWDDASRSMDDLEVMTYYLCHLFTRCTRAISYPAPTYYAHLAAFRIRAYCEGRSMSLDELDRNPRLKEIQKTVSSIFPMFYC